MEFNEMQQGEQEHPQIFLVRLREAADLANITSEEVIQIHFRAGLLREIKQFCIQSSFRGFKDWTDHAEGWWNAHKPRKIAMVDNSFIPRNANAALIYQNDNLYAHHPVNNHNVELVDAAHYEHLTTTPNIVTDPTQLTTMEAVGKQSSAPIRHNHTGANETIYRSSPEDLVNLIQQTIRDKLNIPPKLSCSSSTISTTTTTVKKLNGSIAFNQRNDQSNIQYNNNKSINQPNNAKRTQQSSHNLNVLLSQDVQKQNHQDLYAATRLEYPPIVVSTSKEPYLKVRKTTKERAPITTRRVNIRKHLKEINQPRSTQQAVREGVMLDTELPIEENKPPTSKKPRAKRTSLKIDYNIGDDVLNQKANIFVRDLITVSSALRRELNKECKPRCTTPNVQVMALIEDEEYNTTAVYSKIRIRDKGIKVLIDCGAAKTCMSKALAEALGLEIDAPSESMFTLGNGIKQPAYVHFEEISPEKDNSEEEYDASASSTEEENMQETDPDPDKNSPLNEELFKVLEVGKIEEELKHELRILLNRYQTIFDWDNTTIGHTNLLNYRIVIQENTLSISHRPYRLSPIEAEYLQKETEKYCKLGVITPSNSPRATPVFLIKKKNGEYRMVIDYRKLNAVTKKDSYPLPQIDDLIDTLGKAKIFSALDMRAGFHQVPMNDDGKKLTAFTTKFGTYHYNILPMGLINVW
ncbi:hypothetical protein G6F41_010276 [Rhizopus arrhizus]|nr:hypothetical protein G6F41_010276 [Rhizopus arrhizus]